MPGLTDLYKVVPLSLDPKSEPQIRLLHISSPQSTSKGSNVSAPIQCTLSVHRLRDPKLKFAALSYEWGRPYKPKPGHRAPELVVNNKTIPIQPNLDHALRHLLRGLQQAAVAKTTAKLVIWVDAICINQNDTREKTNQVALMAEIYGRAETTYGWLGLASDKSDVAMAVLDFVGRKMLEKSSGTSSPEKKPHGFSLFSRSRKQGPSPLEEFEALTSGAAVGEWNRQYPDKLLTIAPDLVAKYIPNASFPVVECQDLLSRGYWNRMWIQQELVISRNVVLCCGDARLPLNIFEASLVFLMLLMHHATYGVMTKYKDQPNRAKNQLTARGQESAVSNNMSKWSAAERKNYTLLSPGWDAEALVLRHLRRRYHQAKNDLSLMRLVSEAYSNSLGVRYEVSRHEDRIYGLSGMACDIPRLQKEFGFRFIYGGTCAEAYTNATRAIILSGGVDMLALASGSGSPKIERMPSWVPDFRMPMRRPRGGFPWETSFCVSKGFNIGAKARVDSHEWDAPITLTGCIVDTVGHMTEPWAPGSISCRLQSHQTTGFLNDISNIVWLAGERHKQILKSNPSAPPIYSKAQLEAAKYRIPVADQLQGKTSQVISASCGSSGLSFLSKGYHSVMRELDSHMVSDTKSYIAFRTSVGVKYPGSTQADTFFQQLKTGQPPSSNSLTASQDEFNAKDSYYNMMDRQDGTRPFVGDKGYIGLIPQLSERGDVIAIFRGARFPYVLRKKRSGRYRYSGKGYELVGEAYVYGIMDGEYVQKKGLAKWEDFELV
ncbi:Heterokaryon incompatibility protein (HET) domain containing protein [Naviculisporaceae sp. PSN 640]